MKRFTVATAALVLTLAGCSTGGGDAAGNDSVLTLAAAGSAPAQAVIDAFKAANPGIEVKTTFTEDDASYQQQLRTQLASGTAPDVFRIWPGAGNSTSVLDLSKDGLLADLSGEAWAAKVNEAEKTVSSDANGKLVALPVTIGAIGAVWNDQAVSKSGLAKPATFPQVLEFCKAARGKNTYAFALGLKSAWVTQLIPYALTSSLVYGPNPEFTADQLAGKTTFAASAWKDAMDKYVQMKDAQCFNPSPNGVGYDEQMQMLGQGKALGAVHVLSAVANAKKYATADTTFSMTPFPATDKAADTFVPVSVGIAYAVNAKAKNPELAKKFLDFVAGDQGQEVYATKAAAAPALPTTAFKADALQQPVLDAQTGGRSTVYPDQRWPGPKVQSEHLIAIQELFNGDIDVPTVLKRLDEAFAAEK
ncbi:ABC transporter substrate-binding protein [Paractinoplanes atraurantiacus]|uniref:Raffinose/stachyose/melibiose transport system substrate-binding protein n=1 Tax=Paractinoplanes atraurantiacus TaxID=1036182 RepID=A0A285JYV8_9ACTN|nr:extracellular solute-binding protein [Actinoplanes atraurantiacus]SNY64947.1 raffinose/stachyose/melibiose transport system substrate-binding protein [Actinoplanes atraurantiacus]